MSNVPYCDQMIAQLNLSLYTTFISITRSAPPAADGGGVKFHCRADLTTGQEYMGEKRCLYFPDTCRHVERYGVCVLKVVSDRSSESREDSSCIPPTLSG